MNITKTLVATAAAACFSMSASAMQPLAEEQLSEVTGQAISIFGNLDVNIGSVVYTDTNHGGSFSAVGINATGAIAATLDLLTSGAALTEFSTILGATNAAFVLGTGLVPGSTAIGPTAITSGFYDGSSDVVKIAVPNLGIPDGDAVLLDVSIASMDMGNSGTKSFGSLAINNINLQGTTVYIWAH